MVKIKYGLELGIRAGMEPVLDAAKLAKKGGLDCYLVPETHPKMSGVDALEAIRKISQYTNGMTIGTGVISVYSRYKDYTSRFLRDIVESHDSNESSSREFWLGIGSSTPDIARKWGREMHDPLQNMSDYTRFVKYNNPGVKVLWGVSREKSIEKAASRILPIGSSDLNPDGVIFHMKTPGELKRSIYLVKESLRKSKRKYSEFETVAIRLVYLTQDDDEWRKSAGLTLANYIANNEAYTESLERAGFREDVQNIKFEYNKEPNVKNLINAAKFVSDKMIHELTTHGSPEECAEELRVFGKKCGVKTVVAGLDAGHKDYYKPDFIKKLDELSNNLGS